MSSPLLNLASLLAPIPGDNPAGSPVPFEALDKLKRAREDKGTSPGAAGAEPKKADWPGIVRSATETLTTVSKDLGVAVRLTEALVKVHGFPGLRDALKFLLGLVEQCWDRLYPVLEEGDMEVRAALFNWLDDPDKGARFPNTLRLMPLVWNEAVGYGLEARKPSDKRVKPVPQPELDKALLATDAEVIMANAQALKESRTLLDQLVSVLNQKMGTAAPGLTFILQTVEECETVAAGLAERKGPLPSEEAEPEQPKQKSEEEKMLPGPPKAPATREEAYRQLQQAADLLLRLEPQSPIPHIINRAIQLGGLPFPVLMRALGRNMDALAAMNKETKSERTAFPVVVLIQAAEPPP